MSEILKQQLREEVKNDLEYYVFAANLQDECVWYFSDVLDTFVVILITTDTKANITDGWICPINYCEQVHFSINGDGSVCL